MPAKSEAQRRLFAIAYQVRIGEINKSDVSDEVLSIVDSDMSDKQIHDFMTTESLSEMFMRLKQKDIDRV
jgi:hypothetical protein